MNSSVQASGKINWGKIEVTEGVVGKVTVLKDTSTYSISKNKLKTNKKVKKGIELAVFGTQKYNSTTLYEVGNNTYIKKSTKIKYTKIPKKLLEELKKSEDPQISYLSTLLPGLSYGMSREEVRQVLGIKPDQSRKDSEHYNVSVDEFSPLKKFAKHGETEFWVGFYFRKNGLLSNVAFMTRSPEVLNSPNLVHNELFSYVNSFKSVINQPEEADKVTNDDAIHESVIWENRTENFRCSTDYQAFQGNQFSYTNFSFGIIFE